MSDRDQAVLQERLGGAKLREIGARHGLTPQGVKVVYSRQAKLQIDRLAERLAANRGTSEVEAFVVPNQGGEDLDAALAYFQFCVRELESRGIQLRITYRAAHNGAVFAIEDASPIESENHS